MDSPPIAGFRLRPKSTVKRCEVMSAAKDNEKAPAKRRVPQQVRSRDRVQRILEVAGDIVVDKGVEGVTTRAIAAGAELPVASLYQYFADKEAVLLALVERDIAEIDAQIQEDLASLTVLSVRSMVGCTLFMPGVSGVHRPFEVQAAVHVQEERAIRTDMAVHQGGESPEVFYRQPLLPCRLA